MGFHSFSQILTTYINTQKKLREKNILSAIKVVQCSIIMMVSIYRENSAFNLVKTTRPLKWAMEGRHFWWSKSKLPMWYQSCTYWKILPFLSVFFLIKSSLPASKHKHLIYLNKTCGGKCTKQFYIFNWLITVSMKSL